MVGAVTRQTSSTVEEGKNIYGYKKTIEASFKKSSLGVNPQKGKKTEKSICKRPEARHSKQPYNYK